jgi:hypothetical protein
MVRKDTIPAAAAFSYPAAASSSQAAAAAAGSRGCHSEQAGGDDQSYSRRIRGVSHDETEIMESQSINQSMDAILQ